MWLDLFEALGPLVLCLLPFVFALIDGALNDE